MKMTVGDGDMKINSSTIGRVVVQNGKEIIVNDKKIEIPKHIGTFGNNTSIINNHIFVNGWELKKDGTWKRTLRVLWYLWF